MQQHINHQSWLHDTWSHTQGCSSDAKKGQQQYSRPRLVHCTSTHKCQTATLSIHTVTVCACDLDKQQWHGPGAVNMGPYHLSTTLGLYTHNNVMQYTVTASTEGLLRVIYSSCINYDLSTNQSINQSKNWLLHGLYPARNKIHYIPNQHYKQYSANDAYYSEYCVSLFTTNFNLHCVSKKSSHL